MITSKPTIVHDCIISDVDIRGVMYAILIRAHPAIFGPTSRKFFTFGRGSSSN